MLEVIGVGDMKISTDKSCTLVTYALGSCLGITIYDPVSCVGGLLHIMLPLSTIDSVKANKNPFMFIDTGVPNFFLSAYKAGAKKERLIVKTAGGACTSNNADEDFFNIGKRNFIMLRKLLWKNNVLLKSYDVGGNISRTMFLEIGTGEVYLKINGDTKKL